MSRRPEHDPLGAKPFLPAPSGPGADRAKRVFESYVRRLRDGATVEELTAEGPLDPGPPPAPAAEPALISPTAAASGRRYSVALSKVAGLAPAPEPALADAAVTMVAEPAAEAAAPPTRPPPGAPTIRPPIQRKGDPTTVSQELLEGTADSAMLLESPDGSTSFDIAFNDEVFPDLACRITVLDGRVVATFRVSDPNLRRLLEAEAGRLRAGLEARGLKVAEVKVEVE